MIKNIFLFVWLLSLHSCFGQIKTKNPPKNLHEAIAYLNNDWSSAEKLKFKNQPENKAATSLHFSTGMWIRNTWVHGNRDTSLVNYFNKIGIHAPDDISSIILVSFHRYLNHKPLELEKQIQPIKSYWKAIDGCEIRTREIALKNYKRFSVGNSITILMAVSIADKERNAVLYACPTVDWTFDPKKDLIIGGVVTEKYFINSDTNVFFKVKIDKMNYPNTSILMEKVNIGDVVDFSLDKLTIK